MGCNGACEAPRPTWISTRGNGSIVGVCSAASLEQCNGVFTSDTQDIDTGSATGELTFDVSASNFERFRPRGIRFHVTLEDGTPDDHAERNVAYTAISFQGTNYKLDSQETSLSAFSIYGVHALSLAEFGDLVPGGQDVKVSVKLLATASGKTYRTQAIMYGWAVRGGGSAGSAIVP